MKKGWKIFWITVATIAMVGLTLGIVSSVMGFRISDFWAQYPNGIVIFGDDDDDLDWDDTLDGDNDSDWDDADEDEFQDSADALEYENIKELEVSVGCCEVMIVPGEDEKVRIDTSDLNFGSTGVGVRTETNSDSLKVYMEKDHKIWDVYNIKAGNDGFGTLYIVVPASIKLEIISLNAGAAEIDAYGLRAKELKLQVGAAGCSVENFDVDTMNIEVGAGSLEMDGICNGDINLKCGAGEAELDLEGHDAEYNYHLKCGAGEVEIGKSKYSGMGISENINNGSDKTMDINCGMGNVSISFEHHRS
ncbi:MAG: DUF4097 family beta strand repeat-containing protein [Bariatricus sp.]|nr:DUF4097 family beta strand repeat-containing protein [Bariatricus sp.]